MKRRFSCATICIMLTLIGAFSAKAKVLQGSVEEDAEAQRRLHRMVEPEEDSASAADRSVQRRLHRRIESTDESYATAQAPKQLPAEDITPEDFVTKPAAPYDLEAESGSKELMLAWELWHKQLSHSMWKRERAVGIQSLSATVTYHMTVTKDHHVEIQILTSSGNPAAIQFVLRAAASLEGNPGLTFPEGSKREVATDDHTVIYSPYIPPSYQWEKNDFERLRQNY